MPVKLGTCSACKRPIYAAEGGHNACNCDEGLWDTVRLRENPPKARTASQREPASLPDLDITMLMSPSAIAELKAAEGLGYGASMSGQAPLTEQDWTGMWEEGPAPGDSGMDIEFDTGDEIDFPRASPDRPGRYRVDQGAPAPVPWRRDVVGGPSDGRVVAQVGQELGRAQPVRPRPQPVYVAGREEAVDWLRPVQAPPQEARVVATTSKHGTRIVVPQPAKPAKPALARLGSLDIGDDPFS